MEKLTERQKLYVKQVTQIREEYKEIDLNKKQIAKIISNRIGGKESTHYYAIARIKSL